jgi:putative SOS response-associated peptidase YedK
MPAVPVGVAAEDAWLAPRSTSTRRLSIVRPLPDGLLDVYPLSTKINSMPRRGGSGC